MKQADPGWTQPELRALARLGTPRKIQDFLDSIPYSTEDRYRSPRSVLRERVAHCYDGALFAAAALRQGGHRPLLVNMYAERDDEHLLAVFKRDGHWGAVAKSNFVGLRYRDPVYRTLRELVMSYFQDYFNVQGEKTLRAYTRPLNLARFDRLSWTTSDTQLDTVAAALDKLERIAVLTRTTRTALAHVDERSYRAGMMGTDAAGLYKL